MNIDELKQQHRVILFYNNAISALTLFAQDENGSICTPAPLPALSAVLPEETIHQGMLHPATFIKIINAWLDLPDEFLITEPGFNALIETPKGNVSVYLARFNVLDPPHKLMQDKRYTLKSLPELRSASAVEMELLRRAYTLVMES